ncbi:MAG: cupin domain-containing protein [Candidatus Dadabacteria bacterium]|nr:cupin domain-containing protein [Candidatus Dadabacteria bacterium]
MNKKIAIPPDGGDSFDFGGLGVHWKIEGEETGKRFSVVHHPLAPRALAAPLHYHHNEDEYSYVAQGTLGALPGDEAVIAGRGSRVFKPRGQWHTFWNAGDATRLIIEVISPAGFESYFREVVAARGDLGKFAEINKDARSKWTLAACPLYASGSASRFRASETKERRPAEAGALKL